MADDDVTIYHVGERRLHGLDVSEDLVGRQCRVRDFKRHHHHGILCILGVFSDDASLRQSMDTQAASEA